MDRQVFEFARLQESARDVLLYLGGGAALVVALVWIYRKDTAQLSPAWRTILMGLRIVLAVLLLVIFLEPQTRTETTLERPSRVLVALDTSLSMSLGASDTSTAAQNRLQSAIASLRDAKLIQELRQKHEIALHKFGRTAQSLGLFPRLDPTAPPDPQAEAELDQALKLEPLDDQTRLGENLTSILRENRTAPIAAVVLVTDGQSNAGGGIEPALKLAQDASIPIYPVGVGSENLPTNIRLAELQVPARAFKGDEMRGKAVVRATGLNNQRVSVEILLRSRQENATPILLEKREVDLPSDGAAMPIEFQLLPEQPGPWEIVLRTPTLEGETRQDDNTATAAFDIIEQRTQVLLFAGGPTREYRFLRNLLHRDTSIDVHIYLQSAGASSSQEGDKVLRAFPETMDDLMSIDVIVAIDPDWSSLSTETQTLVVDWVSKHAGGLVLVAGPVHMPRLARSEESVAVTSLYPVILKEVFTSDIDAGRFAEPWPVEFTPEGSSAAYLRLDDDPEISQQLWESFPGVYWCYPVSGLKPAATILATFSDPRARVGGIAPPLFATQFVGSGRVFYMGTGEMWRIRELGEKHYDRFWIRLIREFSQGRLLRGSQRGVILLENDRYPLGETITVRAQLLGTDFQPLAEPKASLSIIEPSGQPSSTELTSQPTRPGLFQGNIVLKAPGEHRLQILIPGSTEVIERRFVVDVPQLEFADPRLNRPLLSQLADQTKGKLLSLDELAQLPSLIEDRTETSILSGNPEPLWDNASVMGAFVLVAGLEWLIRKLVYLA